ncbi:MAG: hypothetical protein ACO1O1_07545 [Adhaeribacter sp.]
MTESVYKELFNASPVALIVTDPKGEIKVLNEQGGAFLGDKETGFTGLNFCDFIDKSYFKDQVQAKTSFEFEDFLRIYQVEHKYWINNTLGQTFYVDIKLVSLGTENQDLYILRLDPGEISRKLSFDLKERVKEQLAILNVIEILFQTSDIHTAIKHSLSAIREGWQYPELTGVRIILKSGEEFLTDNFKETAWLLESGIQGATGEFYGFLAVCYVQEVPANDQAVFLYEEKRLINVLAKLLGCFFEHFQSVSKLKASSVLLKKILSQVPADTCQFEILTNGKARMLFINNKEDGLHNTEDAADLEAASNKLSGEIYEPDRGKFNEAVLKASKSNGFLNIHYRVVSNNAVRWKWLSAVPEKRKGGKTIWYGSTQDITPIVDYITSIEQILFDISHIIRRPISNILGTTQIIKDSELSKNEVLDISKKLLKISEELDRFIKQLNQSYEKKRKLSQDIDIDFSSLIDKRHSFLS